MTANIAWNLVSAYYEGTPFWVRAVDASVGDCGSFHASLASYTTAPRPHARLSTL